jgi:hypothetical protein
MRVGQSQGLAHVVTFERRPPRLDLRLYPYLPRATVATTMAKDYLSVRREVHQS